MKTKEKAIELIKKFVDKDLEKYFNNNSVERIAKKYALKCVVEIIESEPKKPSYMSFDIEETFNGLSDFGKKVCLTIGRNGEIIEKVYQQIDIPKVTAKDSTICNWTRNLGYKMIKQVNLDFLSN